MEKKVLRRATTRGILIVFDAHISLISRRDHTKRNSKPNHAKIQFQIPKSSELYLLLGRVQRSKRIGIFS